MGAQFPIAWRAEDSLRFVGKLILRSRQLELNGTTTTSPRRRRVVAIDRSDVRSAALEQRGEWPTVSVTARVDTYHIEILTGGRGAALVLITALGSVVSHPSL